MGQEFLIDTNVVIASLGNKLSSEGAIFLKTVSPDISVITQIEILGWYGVSPGDLAPLTDFVDKATIYQLTQSIIQKTIQIRQIHKIKTPDAIIAATAIMHDLTLITRNTSDFKQIPGLGLVNPFEL